MRGHVHVFAQLDRAGNPFDQGGSVVISKNDLRAAVAVAPVALGSIWDHNSTVRVASYPAKPGTGATFQLRVSRSACSSAERSNGFCSTTKPCCTASRARSLYPVARSTGIAG